MSPAHSNLQVRNLRPGRTYDFRMTPLPVSDAFVDIPAQQPSGVVAFSTVPTAPSQPEPPALTARARNSLKVRPCAFSLGVMEHCCKTDA